MNVRGVFFLLCVLVSPHCQTSADESWLTGPDESNPWYPDIDFPKLTTPQWVDEQGVEAVVVFAIDDMRDSAKYEQYLRPILNRLKKIDGRAPVSIMTCNAKPDDPQLQSWLEEGLSIEVHTADHPCPILQGGDFEKAKSTYDRCIDLLNKIPGNKPVAFRTPCCDSLNTVSPRFFSEIFDSTTADGHFLQIDSSVFNFFTSEDRSIPRDLVIDDDGKERFGKYLPRNNNYKSQKHDNFVNYIKNYPYPYIINGSCWQFPCVAPSDWSAQHFHGVNNPITVTDWKAALDITVHKQGVFNLVFHPHGWITAEQVVELIDHAVEKHGKKVKFLTFREAADRLNRTLCEGKSLRSCDDKLKATLSRRKYRQEHPSANELRSAPKEIRELVKAGRHEELLPLRRKDGSHNGFFVHQKYLCWQNEDTAHLPDLIRRVSYDELLLEQRHQQEINALPPIAVGAATVDITPEYPVRLSGYGNRASESEGVGARIHARALVIGGGNIDGCMQQPTSILITVDNCGVPRNVTEAVFERIAAKHKIARERFAVSSTHTHSGPWLRGFAPHILTELPADHAAHLKQYEEDLIARMVDVVDKALKSRRPGTLSVGRGELGFAMNRRVINDGRWTGFGETPDGPTDHEMPLLAAHDVSGKLIAVLANYACHATTETGSFNQVSGDWPGFAADMIEADNPDSVALIAIGCGADANPSPRGTHEQARQHGRTVADEVKRLLTNSSDDASALTRIDPRIQSRIAFVDLPLGPLPSRNEWEERSRQPGHAGFHAKKFLQMLDDGKPVPTSVPNYPVQTWCFGKDLAMVFLGGEVVVDYSIRMADMFDADRLWINAYSNDVPCYIASKRILREGGYEADRSMVYYARPTRLAPEAEDVVCDAVQKLLPHEFYSKSLQAEFPAPKSPAESLAGITTRKDVCVELVAAEPLIADPVAFEWDIQGRMWVVEMGGYPSGAGEGNPTAGSGRIRILEDVDRDGRYDKATTYLDDLNFPTGIHRWRNGVIITAAPDILYAEDTDGDLKCDVRHVLYTGFVEGNQQHRVNGLRWGLDGSLYVANGDSGGEIAVKGGMLYGQPADMEGAHTVNIRGRDLKIAPDLGIVVPLSGQTQFGRNRDDYGNWFGNNNSNPIWHYVYEDRYLTRNPHATVNSTKSEVSVTPGAAPVFPTSKTLSRFNDFDKANRFTSACSTAIYRDNLLGDEFYGNAFTCEPVHNLVSRLVLNRDSTSFKGQRAKDELEAEFFANNDNWSRPVMVRTGPDGAMYIADMYRQVIEHPQWIPAEYQRKMNLQAGNKMGRIYRIVPTGTCCTETTGKPDSERERADAVQPESDLRAWFTNSWEDVPKEDLLRRLASPNGWWRDTAQRILEHHGGVRFSPIAEIAKSHTSPAVRVQALHAATNIRSRNDSAAAYALFQSALGDEHPEVRRNALRILESVKLNKTTPPTEQLLNLQNDSSVAVRMQLALTLGAVNDITASEALASLLIKDADVPEVVNAVFSSLTPENVSDVMRAVIQKEKADDGIVSRLIDQAARMNKTAALREPIIAMLKKLASTENTKVSDWRAITETTQSVRRHENVNAAFQSDAELNNALDKVLKRAAAITLDNTAKAELRAVALQFMTTAGRADAKTTEHVETLLNATSPIQVQQAAARFVVRTSKDKGAALFRKWKTISPQVRSTIVSLALTDSSKTMALVDAMVAGHLSGSDIDATARQRLLNHRDKQIRDAVKKLVGAGANSERSKVVAEFVQKTAELSGSSSNGKAVFEKRCATCHRLQSVGKAIGADLAALKDRSTQAMLTAILDPNKAVESKFQSYTAVTTDGLSFNGMLLSETGNSITLMGTDGKEKTIARNDLDELVCSNRSLMPEGLEKDLSPQDLSDVIAFVQSSGAKWKRFDGNTPSTLTPDPTGRISLPASAAEIYGPSLVFEQKYGNLGFWQSTDDYAVWTIDVPVSGFWTVEIDYACDDGTSGNSLKLSTGNRLLSARVPGTGTWDNYKTWVLGKIDLGRGRRQLIVSAPEKPRFALIDLRAIRLIPPK